MPAREKFLREELPALLKQLQPGQQPAWGKMDAQQMVEHLRDVCKLANGKIRFPLVNTDPAKLAAARSFLVTGDPFARNLRVPMVPEEPRPHKYPSIQEAIEKLMEEMNAVFDVYAADPSLLLIHPFFGELDFEWQLIYLEKHVRHHLRQFGLMD